MGDPAVTVVIPTYNRAAYLREALDSVVAQCFRDWEVIVVDDGSTEPITVADHPARPRVIRQTRQGPAAARNRGLRAASADVVAFLDSDDVWLPAKLERFMRAMAEHRGPRLFYGPMSPMTTDGRPLDGRTKPCHGGRITEQLFCSSFVHVPTIVCDKTLLIDAGGFNEGLPVCEDYELWLRLSTRQPFGLIEEPLALRRLHDSRLSKSCMSRNLAVKARVLLDFYESPQSSDFLDRQVGARRLARVCFAAARAAFQNRHYHQALAMARTSRHYGYSLVRLAPIMAAASLLASIKDATDAESAELALHAQRSQSV